MEKDLFLNIPWKVVILDNLATLFSSLVTPEKALLNTLKEVKPIAVIFNTGKKSS